MKEVILLSIGNTHTSLASAAGMRLGQVQRLPTAEFLKAGTKCGELLAKPTVPVFVACVVPHAAACLREQWSDRRLTFLEAGMIREFDFSAVTAGTIGADRLANAVAALELRNPPFLVLDCGTAITLVAVDAQRRFRGGAILPGRRLLRLALHEHTAQLPEVPLQDSMPAALGPDTHAAILAGVDLGVVGAVQFILDNARAELDAPDCLSIVTGGDASYFLSAIPNLVAAPPDFTLRGLAKLAMSAH